MPRFSILLPVRNGGEYLRLCVASILAQTRAGDFDLLVLENGSTDGTAEWLATQRDPRLRVYPAERPLSIEENWARILHTPRGEFMTVIGHDDLLDPGYLATMYALIEENPDAGLYFAHFRLINSQGAFLRHCRPMPARETAAGFLAARFMDLRDTFGTGYLMRTADYDRVGGIPPHDQLIHADDSLWMSLMEGSWMATSPHELFSYRLHGQSASGTSSALVYLRGLERYQEVLAGMARRDPAVREVLARHSPDAYASYAEYLHKRLLLTDLAGQGEYPADAPGRLRRLAERFGGSGYPGPHRKKLVRLLEALGQLPGGRWVYRGMRRLAWLAGQGHRFMD